MPLWYWWFESIQGNIGELAELVDAMQIRPNEVFMTEKEARDISIEVWQYLADHPEIEYKQDIPERLWNKISGIRNNCALCKLYIPDDFDEDGYLNEVSCKDCVLCKVGHQCLKTNSYYNVWSISLLGDKGKQDRVLGAQGIVDILKKWHPENERLDLVKNY